jgi:hypothetical protein
MKLKWASWLVDIFYDQSGRLFQCAYVTSLCVNTSYTNMWHVLENTLSKMFEIVIIKLNSFEKTFWWSCKYKSRSKKFTCPFKLVPMKFLLSEGRITCPGLRASGLRRRLSYVTLFYQVWWDLSVYNEVWHAFFSFLAHLAKGKVSFCHHLASVVR